MMKYNKYIKKLVLASLCLSSFLASAESPWKVVPLNTEMDLESISFIGQFGWIVEQTIYDPEKKVGFFITTDGGETWVKNTALPSHDLRLVEFVSDQTGWAVGEHLWKTIDGGASWVQLNTNLPASDRFSGIDFIDEQQGWIVEGEQRASDGILYLYGTVYATKDGGKHWDKTPLSDGFFGADIQFYDAYSGWIIPWGHKGLFHTIDGGETWDSKRTGDIHYLMDIDLFSEQEGWALGYAYNLCSDEHNYTTYIYYSSDAGKTIKEVNASCSLSSPNEIDFADAQHGWVADSHRILSTNDKGWNWVEEYQLLDETDSIKSLHMINTHSGWAVSRKGLLLKYSATPIPVSDCVEENVATFFQSDDNAFRLHVPNLKDERPAGLGFVQADFLLHSYAPDGKPIWLLTSYSKKENPCIDDNVGTLSANLDFKLPKIRNVLFGGLLNLDTSFIFSGVDEDKHVLWTQVDSEVE